MFGRTEASTSFVGVLFFFTDLIFRRLCLICGGFVCLGGGGDGFLEERREATGLGFEGWG